MNKKISIVVPVYKVENYIRECADSILSQTYHNLEIIFVDDGSPDNCGTILDQYAIQDPRIKVIHKNNGGVSAARNDGLQNCTGEYIYIMDSDDYLELDALGIMLENALRTDADVVITDHFTFKESSEQIESHYFAKEFITTDRTVLNDIQKMILYRNYSPFPTKEFIGLGIATPWNKLIKRDLIFDNGLRFDSNVKGIFDDGLFSLNVMEHCRKLSYIRYNAYHYRIIPTSLMRRFNPDRIKIDKTVFYSIDEFIRHNEKENILREAYYARVVLYFVKSLRFYFFHKDNLNSWQDRYREFVKMQESEPYKEAIDCVDLRKLATRILIVTFLCRCHMQALVWAWYSVSRK